jgi:hypothetical protein
MTKSTFAVTVAEIQRALTPFLRGLGFGVRGRAFNRTTEDGLVQSWVQDYIAAFGADWAQPARDKILAEWRERTRNFGASGPPRIVTAIILNERGQTTLARALLSGQAMETLNPGHPAYMRKLANQVALGGLGG